jgi:hypothetical protein
MLELLIVVVRALTLALRGHRELVLENLALRQQLAAFRAMSTDIVDFLARVVVPVTNAPHRPSEVERGKRMADDRPRDDDVSPAATL